MQKFNILVIEDDYTGLQLLKRVLEKENYSVIPVDNVEDGFAVLKREQIDLIVADWMMPKIDGIELLFRLKATFVNPPPVIIVTALGSPMAKEYALRSGANEFFEKPLELDKFTETVSKILSTKANYLTQELILPPFISVGFLSGSGGAKILPEIFSKLKDFNSKVVYTLIQQGDKVLVDSLLMKLKEIFSYRVSYASDKTKPELNNVYIAPYDYQMFFNSNYELVLDKGPKENYQRPSAEPLFRSFANYFGKFSIAVILSGLGTDGIQGAKQIKSTGGTIICQEPSSALAPSLPKTFISSSLEPIVAEPEIIPEIIISLATDLVEKI
jgi:two-component system chemotaxis response regulator CheB